MKSEPVDCIVPARMASSRFPGKPLVEIAGVPLVVRSAWCAQAAGVFRQVLVATEDEEILEVCARHGVRSLFTPSFPTGTDRVAWASEELESPWVVNLQGDEPVFPPEVLRSIVAVMGSAPQALWTVANTCPMTEKERTDPDVVKIVLHEGAGDVRRVQDFYRLPETGEDFSGLTARHVGLYAGRGEVLQEFARRSPTPREECRRIEPLRALDTGMEVQSLVARFVHQAVDRREHIFAVEKLLEQRTD